MPEQSAAATAAGLFGGGPFPMQAGAPASILDHLDRQAAARGDAPYLTVVSDGSSTGTLNYRELDRYSRRIAYWLTTAPAVRRGTAVGLAPVNDTESVLALFGALRAGVPALMLNPADPAARLAEQTAALGVSVVLHGSRTPDTAGAVRIPDPARLPDPPAGHAFPAVRADDDALYFGTSGSTAAAKLVAQKHANAAANVQAVLRHHGLGPGDTFLGCLPIHHVNGVHFTLFGTLAAGAHAVLASRFDPFTYPALVRDHRPCVASVVPSILDALVATWRRPALPPEFRYFVSAAAPLAAATARAVHERLGARVLQGYGLTETTNFSMTLPRGLSDDAYRRLMLEADVPSVGVAVDGNEVAVLRADGSRAEPGEIGEVCMRGHNVMSRYVNNTDATEEAFQGGWFHSQDLGYEFLEPELDRPVFVLTGRIKNIAKVRGETVSLEEMERVLREFPGVLDAACSALPDPLLGESVAAAVVAPPEVGDAALRAHLARHFAEAVLPFRYRRVEQVPRTPTGKILRPALRELLASSD